MKLSLVLALALLGAVSAHQLDEGALEQEIPDEEGEEESGEPETPCPTESETFRMVMTGTGGRTYTYVFVSRSLTFSSAQHLCSRCYRGRLASIHSGAVNQQLHRTARTRTKRRDVWIGGKTSCGVFVSVHAHWMDHSIWNYSKWAPGYPKCFRKKCVTMCTANGLWRCLKCGNHLPFICEY